MQSSGQPPASRDRGPIRQRRMTIRGCFFRPGADSFPCREYTLEALIGGQPETIYGTACRQADGSWKMEPRLP